MSYQEYAQLGKNNRSNNAQRDSRHVSSQEFGGGQRVRPERPYTGSMASFSVPRRSTTPGHSSSSSISTESLSPSNSASQKVRPGGGSKASSSPTNSQWSDGSNRGLPFHHDTSKLAEFIDEKKPDLIDVPMPWRPLYLRRKILVSFTVIVTGLAVSIGALFDLSNRNLGLGPTSSAGHYLWRFTPTALLTLLAAIWSRTDYQAKLVAPWVRLSKGPAKAENTLLLDYLNMLQPVAVLRAFQNRDFAVACTSAVTLLLRIIIVLSTGLITLSLVSGIPGAPRKMSSSLSTMEVAVQTSFVDNTTDMTNAGALAFFTVVGLQQDDVYFPDGVSERFAYQKFTSDLPQGSIVRTTVDGFSAGLDCEVAELSLTGAQVSRGIQRFNTSVSAGGCDISLAISSEGFVPFSAGTQEPFFFSRFDQGSCGDSGLRRDQRMVVAFGTATIDSRSISTNSSTSNTGFNGTISRSTQLICQPTYSIMRVDVSVQDSTLLNITASKQRKNRTLPGVEPWDFAGPFFSSYRNENELASLYADSSPWFYQPDILNVDAAMFLALDLQLGRTGSPVPPDELFNATVLQGVAADHFQQYAAVLASRSLTQPASLSVRATASTMSERLIVSPLIAKLMIILMGMTAAFAAAAVFAVPKSGILPRDPGTIMNTAALVANSRGLLQSLRGAGGADMRTLNARLAGAEFYTGVEPYERSESTGSGYFKILGGHGLQEKSTPDYVEASDKFAYPSLLHPVQRGAAFLITIGLIVGLDLTYQSSKRNGGLVDAEDDTYPHLLWTVVPAIGIGLITLYFIMTDFMIRTLAPYFALRRGASIEQSISLNLVDRAVPVVIYRALKSRNLAVGGATTAAFFSSLFVIFAGTLFSAATVPATAQCQLLSRDFFSQSNGIPGDGFCTSCQNGTVLSSLVLDANMSYPAFTFEDLAYPSFSLENVPDDIELPDDLVVNAVVPAVRSSLKCQSFRQSDLETNLTTRSTLNGVANPLQVTLPGDAGNDENTITISTAHNLDSFGNPIDTAVDRNAFFGAGEYKPVTDGNTTLPRWVWIWGQLENAGTNDAKLMSVSALTCNETMQQLNVATSFIGSDLHIDTEYKPPVRDEATVITVPIAIDRNLDYSELIQLSTPHLLDPFFSSLVSSRFAIPVTSLGFLSGSDADKTRTIQSVSDAITHQHKTIRAQIVSTWNRRGTVSPISSSGSVQPQAVVFPVDTSGVIMGNATTLAFPAVLTVSNLESGAARRVVQDMTSTRILQALLSATLIAAAASWLALPKPNTILPRPPTSIASVAALLADGNVFGLLGRGAEWSPLEDLYAYFKDGLHVSMGFQLGWERLKRRRREETLSVWGMNGAGEKGQVFGVSAIRTGGWGGGENVGLGLQARVGFAHRSHVRDWGWRT